VAKCELGQCLVPGVVDGAEGGVVSSVSMGSVVDSDAQNNVSVVVPRRGSGASGQQRGGVMLVVWREGRVIVVC
jgi:hypothetical protein